MTFGASLEPVMNQYTDAALMEWYQQYRDWANEVALELEKRGFTGEYLRETSNEWKPLDPTTRPTQFQWRPS